MKEKKVFVLEAHRINSHLQTSTPSHIRLGQDFRWRLLRPNQIMSIGICDYTTTNPEDITKYCILNKNVYFKNNKFEVWNKNIPAMDPMSFTYRSRIFRRRRPRKPTVKEMKQVLAKGGKDIVNRLIVNVDGHFQLITGFITEYSRFNPEIACYLILNDPETQLGPQILKNSKIVKNIYLSMIEEWRNHLENGATNIPCRPA